MSTLRSSNSHLRKASKQQTFRQQAKQNLKRKQKDWAMSVINMALSISMLTAPAIYHFSSDWTGVVPLPDVGMKLVSLHYSDERIIWSSLVAISAYIVVLAAQKVLFLDKVVRSTGKWSVCAVMVTRTMVMLITVALYAASTAWAHTIAISSCTDVHFFQRHTLFHICWSVTAAYSAYFLVQMVQSRCFLTRNFDPTPRFLAWLSKSNEVFVDTAEENHMTAEHGKKAV